MSQKKRKTPQNSNCLEADLLAIDNSNSNLVLRISLSMRRTMETLGNRGVADPDLKVRWGPTRAQTFCFCPFTVLVALVLNKGGGGGGQTPPLDPPLEVAGYKFMSKYTKEKIPLKILMQYNTQHHLSTLRINTSLYTNISLK